MALVIHLPLNISLWEDVKLEAQRGKNFKDQATSLLGSNAIFTSNMLCR